MLIKLKLASTLGECDGGCATYAIIRATERKGNGEAIHAVFISRFFIHKSRVGALPCEVRCFYERAYNGSSNSTKSYSLVCVCTRVSELFQAAIFVLAAAATAAADTAVTTAARSRAREIIGNSLKV